MRLFYAFILILFGTNVYAQSSSLNLAIPGGPQSYQSDKFRAGDLDCSNAIGSATYVEFGVTGIINKDENPYDLPSASSSQEQSDVGVYGRIVIPLGAKPKARVNCSELFELELRKKRLEVMRLEQEINNLKELQFKN